MILALIIAGGCALAWLMHRSHKRCVTCRRRFPSVAARAQHERIAHHY